MARRRSGFIVIFGTRFIASRENAAPVEMVCPGCGQPAHLFGKVGRTWFTLFFLPVFPMQSMAKGHRFCECSACRGQFDLSIDELRQRLSRGRQTPWQQAIDLYNQLRDHPGDSAMLLQVMQAYAAMGEYREAATTARTFPQALDASPACQELLKKVLAVMDAPPAAANK